MSDLTQDWRANAGTPRIQLTLVLFRAAQAARARFGGRHPVALAVNVAYWLMSSAVCSFDLPVGLTAGPGLTIYHGYGLVINAQSVLGANVVLRHGVTIGNAGSDTGFPIIGDGVLIGAGATIIGAITVGDGATIGAHALVTTDVPAGGRARSVPAEVTP